MLQLFRETGAIQEDSGKPGNAQSIWLKQSEELQMMSCAVTSESPECEYKCFAM